MGKKRLLIYLVMLLSVIISVNLVKEIIRLKPANKRLIEAETELLLVKQEQEELKKQLAEVEDRSWWERQVRNVLKMAKTEEVVVVVPEEVIKSGNIDSPFVKAAGDENSSNFQKWWQVLAD